MEIQYESLYNMAYSIVRIHNYSYKLAKLSILLESYQDKYDALTYWIAVFSKEVMNLKENYSIKFPSFNWDYYEELGGDCCRLMIDGTGKSFVVEEVIRNIVSDYDGYEENETFEFGIQIFHVKEIVHFCVNEMNLHVIEINKSTVHDDALYPFLNYDDFLKELIARA